MLIEYLPGFARQYKKLPNSIQDNAEEKEAIFRMNPFDPKLKTHKLSGRLEGFLAFSVNSSYRIIFDLSKDRSRARFYSIGTHRIYE